MPEKEMDVKRLVILGGYKVKEYNHCKILAQSAYQEGKTDDFFEWSKKSQKYAIQIDTLGEVADIIGFMGYDEYMELIHSEE